MACPTRRFQQYGWLRATALWMIASARSCPMGESYRGVSECLPTNPAMNAQPINLSPGRGLRTTLKIFRVDVIT
jgi:hypothetical protein